MSARTLGSPLSTRQTIHPFMGATRSRVARCVPNLMLLHLTSDPWRGLARCEAIARGSEHWCHLYGHPADITQMRNLAVSLA
jgi:hypothetical protein